MKTVALVLIGLGFLSAALATWNLHRGGSPTHSLGFAILSLGWMLAGVILAVAYMVMR